MYIHIDIDVDLGMGLARGTRDGARSREKNGQEGTTAL